jgi:GNAT superfamily N-acetyltransferase
VLAVRLRRARDDDTDAVAAIWASGWRDGHLGHVPEALVRARTQESFRDRAAQRIRNTVVADIPDGDLETPIAGFVTVVDDEVEQVYVAAGHRGSGVARLLLAEAERLVAAAGHRRAWLAVVDGNARARSFYERQGWLDEGMFDYLTAAGGEVITVPCLRYVKDLPPDPD